MWLLLLLLLLIIAQGFETLMGNAKHGAVFDAVLDQTHSVFFIASTYAVPGHVTVQMSCLKLQMVVGGENEKRSRFRIETDLYNLSTSRVSIVVYRMTKCAEGIARVSMHRSTKQRPFAVNLHRLAARFFVLGIGF